MKIRLHQIHTKTVLIVLLYTFFLFFSACTNPFMKNILGQGSGSGSRINPWRISSADDLLKIVSGDEPGWTLDAYYRLTGDITLPAADWIPIGYEASNIKSFTGTFDGAGYTIYNLTINMDASDQGLFAEIGSRGTVRNLKLDTVSITTNSSSYQNIGSLAGSNNGTVENCHVSGNVSGGSSTGGLIGSNTGTIRNSSSAASIEDLMPPPSGDSGTGFGSLVGSNGESGRVEYSFATGNVNAPNAYSVGGLVGNNRGTVRNSDAAGNVTGRNQVGGVVGDNFSFVRNSSSSGNVNGRNHIGGVVGRNAYSLAVVEFCYATGTITSNEPSAYSSTLAGTGGIVGFNEGTVQNCYAEGNVTIENPSHSGSTNTVPPPSVGGIAGINTGTIQLCYATGTVSTSDTISTNKPYVGGVVGANGWGTGTSNIGTVQNNVALNLQVTAVSGSDIGRVAGFHAAGGSLSNNHARGDMSVTVSGTAKSTLDTGEDRVDGETTTSWPSTWFRSIGFTNSWWTGRLP